MPEVEEGRKDDDAPPSEPSLGVPKVINTFEFAGGTARIAWLGESFQCTVPLGMAAALTVSQISNGC